MANNKINKNRAAVLLIFDINFPFLLLTEAEPINKYMLVSKRFYILCLTICPTKIHFK